MEIIKLNEKHYINAQQTYDMLDSIFEFGNNYLPFLFLETIYKDGVKFKIPKWITSRYYDELSDDIKDIIKELT